MKALSTLLTSLVALAALGTSTPALAADSTLYITQVHENHRYGEVTITMPNGSTYLTKLVTKTLERIEAGTYKINVNDPTRTNTTEIRVLKNDILVAETFGNVVEFDVEDGDTIRVTVEYSYADPYANSKGNVEVTSLPNGVPFTLRGPDGLKVHGETPAFFPGMDPTWYRLEYDIESHCEAQKYQERALNQGSNLIFFANFNCGPQRVPTAGRTGEPLGTGNVRPEPQQMATHTELPGARIVQTSSVAETLPGGRVRFTVSVRNLSRNTLHNVVVSDRYNPEALQVLLPLADGGATDGNSIIWELPVLYAGQTWTTTFEGRVSDTLVAGDRIVLMAHVYADELGTVYPDAVSSVIGVGVAYMPQTGGRWDIVLSLAGLIGAAYLTHSTIRRKKLVAFTA